MIPQTFERLHTTQMFHRNCMPLLSFEDEGAFIAEGFSIIFFKNCCSLSIGPPLPACVTSLIFTIYFSYNKRRSSKKCFLYFSAMCAAVISRISYSNVAVTSLTGDRFRVEQSQFQMFPRPNGCSFPCSPIGNGDTETHASNLATPPILLTNLSCFSTVPSSSYLYPLFS